MFYAIAKSASALLLPSALGLLAATLGLLLFHSKKYRKLGLVLISTSISFLAIVGISPLANIMLYPLEQRFADIPIPRPSEHITGIIILGGFETASVTAARPGLALNESAERLTESVRLAKRWPNAKLVFTGGVAGLFPTGPDASGPIADYLVLTGVARHRIVLDGEARDTYENAKNTRALVNPQPGEKWILVTSAFHIPRATGVFRKAGFGIIPIPVDYRLSGASDMLSFFDRPSRGLMRADTVTKEWIGLLVYYLSGRSSALFPGPQTN